MSKKRRKLVRQVERLLRKCIHKMKGELPDATFYDKGKRRDAWQVPVDIGHNVVLITTAHHFVLLTSRRMSGGKVMWLALPPKSPKLSNSDLRVARKGLEKALR